MGGHLNAEPGGVGHGAHWSKRNVCSLIALTNSRTACNPPLPAAKQPAHRRGRQHDHRAVLSQRGFGDRRINRVGVPAQAGIHQQLRGRPRLLVAHRDYAQSGKHPVQARHVRTGVDGLDDGERADNDLHAARAGLGNQSHHLLVVGEQLRNPPLPRTSVPS